MLDKSLIAINLKQELADYGFESHEDFGFVLKQLLNKQPPNIKCLNLSGNSGRRKTAFAHALGLALNFEHTLYHDFSQIKAPQPLLELPEPEDKTLAKERPISALDRIVSDACAFSEAENTLLIFDQMQLCDFRHQVRLHQLLVNNTWQFPKNEFIANPSNLTVILISEETLYHSLQKNSFKVWISKSSGYQNLPTAKQLNKTEQLQPVLDALDTVFKLINTSPTDSELLKIINDIDNHIHTVAELSASLFGWVEGLDYQQLQSKDSQKQLSTVIPIIDSYLGIDQLEIL